MCGIAGIFGLGHDLTPGDGEHLTGMTTVLRHRGPDSTGYHRAARCMLGNTRLNIIDLSSNADLPMANADGTVFLAYNGEVTNHQELALQYGLAAKYPFRSSSDGEVVLHLYEELGPASFALLTGMFAFCLYDTRIGKAWVVRDFFGIRPLFWMRGPDRLYFASEIKSFLDLPSFTGELDLEGFYDYFSLAYIPEEHTPFKDVVELQGGRLIEIDLASGAVNESSYYEVDYKPDYSIREKDIAPLLYEQMRDSVRRNMISDAPLGLTFSGGFDTSSILALARDVAGHDRLHTYSIVMEEKSFDESSFQYQMVDPRSEYHHEVRVGPRDVMDHLLEHMAFMDEPSGDGAAIPSFLLAREARKTVSVLLSGEGGDETFNAYETHMAHRVRGLYRKFVPRSVRNIVHFAAHRLPCNYDKLSFDFVAKRFTEGAEMSAAEAHLHWRHCLTEQDKQILMPGCRGMRPTSQLFTDVWDSLDFEESLNRISVMDLKHYFIGDLMVKNDRTMMASSVEARFPYMDRLLLEFAAKIPPAIRMKGFTRRSLQKKAMTGRLPRIIAKRQNMGLEMPHSHWFLGEMRPMAEHYFSRSTVARCGILDPDVVARLWQEHLERRRDHGRALWCIVNLLVWFELFVHSRDYKRYLHPAKP